MAASKGSSKRLNTKGKIYNCLYTLITVMKPVWRHGQLRHVSSGNGHCCHVDRRFLIKNFLFPNQIGKDGDGDDPGVRQECGGARSLTQRCQEGQPG